MSLPGSVAAVVASLIVAVVSPSSSNARTLSAMNAIPPAVLQRGVSPQFYKSLMVSPVNGWIVVRGQLSGTHLSGTRILQSDAGGAYDSLALDIAGKTEIQGYNSLGHLVPTAPVLVHVLLYKIADGLMVLSFVNIDNAGGNQLQYYGCSRLEVLKDDGTWVHIKSCTGLEGKGYRVRNGLANDFDTLGRMEKLIPRSGGTR